MSASPIIPQPPLSLREPEYLRLCELLEADPIFGAVDVDPEDLLALFRLPTRVSHLIPHAAAVEAIASRAEELGHAVHLVPLNGGFQLRISSTLWGTATPDR